jgi:hypothetical protein
LSYVVIGITRQPSWAPNGLTGAGVRLGAQTQPGG